MKGLKRTLICLFLAGCGGDEAPEQSYTNNGSSNSGVIANNVFQVVKPNTRHIIDTKIFLRDSTAFLTALTPNHIQQSDRCHQADFDHQDIYLSLEAGDYCSYEYQIRNENGTAAATLEVFSTEASKATLQTISTEFNLREDQQISINIENEGVLPEGYTLDPSSIKVYGLDEETTGAAQATGGTITYTAPTLKLPGWNRIHYNAVGQNGLESSPMMGIMYISLLDGANLPPYISDHNFESPDKIQVGETTAINLAKLDGLEIHDGEEGKHWQVVYATSQTLDVKLTNPNSTSNTSISVNPPSIEEHFITYIVADHQGASNVGHLTIQATSLDVQQDWKDAEVGKIDDNDDIYIKEVFLATPRYFDVMDKIEGVGQITDTGVKNIVATFNLQQAQAYCAGEGENMVRGNIPTLEQLQILNSLSFPSKSKSNFENTLIDDNGAQVWPRLLPYLAIDTSTGENTYVAYYFNQQTVKALDPDQRFYVSCVNDGRLSLEKTASSIEAGEVSTKVLTIHHEAGAEIAVSAKYLYQADGGSFTYDEKFYQVKPMEGDETKTEIWTSNTETILIDFTVTSKDLTPADTPTPPVYPDASLTARIEITPKLTNDITVHSITILPVDPYPEYKPEDNINIMADGVHSAELEVLLHDVYGNPIKIPDIVSAAVLNVEDNELGNKPNATEALNTLNDDASLIEIKNYGLIDSYYTFRIKGDEAMQSLPLKATFRITVAPPGKDPIEIDTNKALGFFNPICPDTSDNSANSNCIKILKLKGTEEGKPVEYQFAAAPSRKFYAYRRKKTEQLIDIPTAVSNLHAAAIANSKTALDNADIGDTFYPIPNGGSPTTEDKLKEFAAVSDYEKLLTSSTNNDPSGILTEDGSFLVAFSGFPKEDDLQYLTTFPAAREWCSSLSGINKKQWQILNEGSLATQTLKQYIADGFNNQARLTTEQAQAETKKREDPSRHILYTKHGWHLRVQDHIAWMADGDDPVPGESPSAINLTAMRLSDGETIKFHSSYQKTSEGADIITGYAYGMAICQATVATTKKQPTVKISAH